MFCFLILAENVSSGTPKFYENSCEYFLSYSLTPDQKIKITDTNSVLHSGIFKRYNKVTKLVEFTNDSLTFGNKTQTIQLSQIDLIKYDAKKLDMGQFRQATVIGTVGGLLVGLVYISTNIDFSGNTTGSGEKFRKAAGITLFGTLIGGIAGLIGNDKIVITKTIECN